MKNHKNEIFSSYPEYIDHLANCKNLPDGFQASVQTIEFFAAEKKTEKPFKMNLSLISCTESVSSFAAVFTRNLFCGHPVKIGRKRLSEPSIRGLLVNNKVSNVHCPGGEEDSEALMTELAALFETDKSSFIPSSTGIIGWKLPLEVMKSALPVLKGKLASDTGVDLAKAIMTTDAFPKLRQIKLADGKIWGAAKGAGMIEPNLATMLVFILTDLKISRDELRKALNEAVQSSFNAITVDSDQSTSDSVFLLSSGKKSAVSYNEFTAALKSLCQNLSEDIVRNGEGVNHVIRAEVSGFSSERICHEAGKAVVNSPLVKTAVYGNDPNVGRLLSSIGDYLGNAGIQIDKNLLEIYIGNELVFSKGSFLLDEKKEDLLFHYLKDASLKHEFAHGQNFPPHTKDVVIQVVYDNNRADTFFTVFGNDLSYDYVKENAEYRS